MIEQIDLHWLACELDHDIKNHAEGLDRIRWNNRAMILMLKKVQSLRAACEEFIRVNRCLEYEFDTNEPVVYGAIADAVRESGGKT